jgi:aspartate/methionine/tyrosine aminotransferase
VLINPGDEIIVTDPGFASHFQQIKLCGGNPIYWRLDESGGWALNLDALPGLITDRTKAIVLVTPSNPTGKIFLEAELRRIGELAIARNFLILLDDPYSHFIYENGERYFNLASAPELTERVAYLFTFSKTYAMSGWRLGYMVLPEALKKEVVKVHDATLICAPRISQIGGLAALTEPQTHLREFEDILASRRSLICERLDRVAHVFQYVKPEGAYYVFPKIVVDHDDALTFCLELLAHAHVTLTPGGAFGPAGEHHVRMAFCVEEKTIELAFDRIEKFFG